MMRKLLIGGLAATGLTVAVQRHDIVRYLKIKQMSWGDGHPEIVPASGATSYPAPGRGAPDGTGEALGASSCCAAIFQTRLKTAPASTPPRRLTSMLTGL